MGYLIGYLEVMVYGYYRGFGIGGGGKYSIP